MVWNATIDDAIELLVFYSLSLRERVGVRVFQNSEPLTLASPTRGEGIKKGFIQDNS